MKAFRHLAWTLALLVPLYLTPVADAASTFPGVGTVNYDAGSNTVTLSIPYRGRNPYRVLWLNGPSRLVVDIEGMTPFTGKRAMFIGGGVVTQIRAARWQTTKTRLVFDLSQAADFRSVTDADAGVLELTIFPRGSQPSNMIGMEPQPRPTRRPVPQATPFPTARVTPIPIETPYVPEPMPTSVPTFEPTPEPYIPTPEPMFTPEPMQSEAPTAVVEQEFAVFGSRLSAGAEVGLSLSETYVAGGSDSTVPLPVGAVFQWDQLFSPYFGISLTGRALSYTLDDEIAADLNYQLQHRRDEYEGSLGFRGRYPVGGGLELFVQPGAILRTVSVANTLAPIVDDEVGDVEDGVSSNYLSTGWLGYGGQFAGGVGYHVFGPMSLAATGEFNYLLGGMNNVNVATIFPLTGYRAGLETRLDFGFLGLTLGYNLTGWSHGGETDDESLSQSVNGPFVKLNLVY